MKQLIITFLTLVAMSMSVQAQTWDGSVSSVWGDLNNWTPATVPLIGSAVIIPNGTPNNPMLSAAVTIASLTMNAGSSLNLNAQTMTVNGNVNLVNSTITGGGVFTVNNPSIVTVTGNTITTTFSINNYTSTTNILNNTITGNTVIKDSSTHGSTNYIGGNSITGNFTLTHCSGSSMHEGYPSGNQVTGNVIINVIQSGSNFLGSYATGMIIGGNLSINHSTGGSCSFFTNAGGSVGGNVSLNVSGGGSFAFGNAGNNLPVGGTFNANCSSVTSIDIERIKNQVAGGTITITNPTSVSFQKDSIKSNVSITGYSSTFNFLNNSILGNTILSSSNSQGSTHYLGGNLFTGNLDVTDNTSNPLYEAYPTANHITGNTVFTIQNNGGNFHNCYSGSTIFDGNLTINHTSNGSIGLFEIVANVGGNFSLTSSGGGAVSIGNTGAVPTIIGGTLNITCSLISTFYFNKIKNLTVGGNISVSNATTISFQNDSIKSNVSITGYMSTFNFLYNSIIGNVTLLSDLAQASTNYFGGNIITGNLNVTHNTSNVMHEGYPTANNVSGNATFIIQNNGTNFRSSYNGTCSYGGNVSVTYTNGGGIFLFENAAIIGGNFTLNSTDSGSIALGHGGIETTIGGTVNINSVSPPSFQMLKLSNAVGGGAMSISHPNSVNILNDSISSTMSILNYNSTFNFANNAFNTTVLSDSVTHGSSNYIGGNLITGDFTHTHKSATAMYEGYTGTSTDNISGNAIFNIQNSGASFNMGHSGPIIVGGDLTVNHSTAGTINILANHGGTIGGNFTINSTGTGAINIGSGSLLITIGGTINMTSNASSNFSLSKTKNALAGGSITVTNSGACDFRYDSLKANVTVTGYSSTFNFLHNTVQGNTAIADAVTHGSTNAIGGNLFTGNLNLTHNAADVMYEGYLGTTNNRVTGDAVFTNNGTGLLQVGYILAPIFNKNITFTSNAGPGFDFNRIIFEGNTDGHVIQGGTFPLNFHLVTLSKTSPGRLYLDNPVMVSITFTFNTGYLVSTPAASLIFKNGISYTGASDNSHVVGTVTKIGNQAFTFPLGNGIGLNTIAITSPGATTDSFQASIILKHPDVDGYLVSSKVAALLQIAPYHYWTLNQISGSSAESVSLGWGNPCVNAGITNLPSLAVARWVSTQWLNDGNSATTGAPAAGTVTQTGTTTSFGVYALATTSLLNQWIITSVSASASTVCAGTPTTLTGAGASTYNWQPGNLSGTSVVVTPLTTTTYTVSGTSSTGCITTATKTIIVNPVPPTNTTTSATAICIGNSVTITGTGANTYVWQPGGSTANPLIVSPASTTTYTVTGTFTATGCTKTATRLITVNPLPAVSTSASATTLCAGASTTITASNANTYVWQPGGSTANPLTVTPANTTTYTVTGTNTTTGCTNTATRLITVNPLPAVGTTASATTICAGASTTLTGTNANTYVWQPGGSTANPLTVTPANTTTYTVTGTNTTTGCTNTATRLITVNPLPAVGTTASATTICAGASTTLTGTNANTYVWQPGGSTANPLTVSPASTTTYTVTGTNTTTGCTNTATRLITVNPLPAVGTTASATTICAGASTTLTGTNANTYVWQPGGSTANPLSVTPASTTTYTVTGTTTATGCTNTATRLITVNPLPAVGTTASATTICAGASTTLTGTNANTYVWQPGGSTANPLSVTPASTTTYTVTGTTTATGCTNTATRLITVNPLPSVGTTASATTICAGSSTTLTGTNANTYVWQPGGSTANPITVTPATTTTYTVTGTNTATGCTNTATRLITVNNCNTTVNLKLFIEGFYIGPSLMQPVLFNQAVSLSTTVTDSITVNLRNTTSPYAIVRTVKTLLNTNGTAACVFTPFISGTFFIEVAHRNAVKTWSAAGVSVGAVPVTYNFSDAATKAYDLNMKLMSTSPNVYAFYSGDLNQDENIDLIDISILEQDISNFLFGYLPSDLNGDGNSDILDTPMLEANVNNFIFAHHP